VNIIAISIKNSVISHTKHTRRWNTEGNQIL